MTERGYPAQISLVQAWLLGYIDLPTLRDRAADLGEAAMEVHAAYGRAIEDEAYAQELIAQAQRVLEGEAAAIPDRGIEAER